MTRETSPVALLSPVPAVLSVPIAKYTASTRVSETLKFGRVP
jgi:hypothetical protein